MKLEFLSSGYEDWSFQENDNIFCDACKKGSMSGICIEGGEYSCNVCHECLEPTYVKANLQQIRSCAEKALNDARLERSQGNTTTALSITVRQLEMILGLTEKQCIPEKNCAAASEGYEIEELEHQRAFNTGRPLFRVFCKTCLVCIHEATTSPDHQIKSHEEWVQGHLEHLRKERDELKAESHARGELLKQEWRDQRCEEEYLDELLAKQTEQQLRIEKIKSSL